MDVGLLSHLYLWKLIYSNDQKQEMTRCLRL